MPLTRIKGSSIEDGSITIDDIDLSTLDTDNISEGANNQYFTTARANSAIDARVTQSFVNALNITASDADTLDGQQGSYYTQYTDNAIAALANSAPATLDTLNELAAALGDDANFSTTVTNSIATKLPLAGGTLTGNLNINKDNPQIQLYDTGAGGTIWRITNGPDGNGKLTFNDNDTERVTFTNSGNVGIGTNDPSVKLEVSGSGKFTGLTEFTNAINLTTSTLNYVYFNDALAFAKNGTGERFRVTSSGVDVTGNLNADGATIDTATGNINFGTDAGGSISIGLKNDTSSTPYFDFNTGSTTVDYDARIQGSGGNGTSGNGTISITAATLNVPANVVLSGTGRIQGIDTVSAGTDAANKTYVDTAVSGAGGGFEKARTYYYSSSDSFVPPENADYLVIVIGAGGSGGAGTGTWSASGGGAGGVAIKTLTLSTGTTYTVTVGAGGTGGQTGTRNGTAGGASSFSGSGITTLTGNGGSGGAAGAGASSGGAGGSASGGDYNYTGGSGGEAGADSNDYQTSSGGGAISNLFQNGLDAPDVSSFVNQPSGAGVISSGGTGSSDRGGDGVGPYAVSFPLDFSGVGGDNGGYITPSEGGNGGNGSGGGGGGGAGTCFGGDGGFGGGGGGSHSVNGSAQGGSGGIGGGGGGGCGQTGNGSINGAGGDGAVFIVQLA